MRYTKMQTRWEVNKDGDLIFVGSGDPAWRTTSATSHSFPMCAEDVAMALNRAFQTGAAAKLDEIRGALGLGGA